MSETPPIARNRAPSDVADDPWERLPGDADDLRALREALEDLRSEIRTRFGAVARREETPPARPTPAIDWDGMFSQLRRRLATFGMREYSGEVDAFGFDADALESVRPVLDFLYETYWRVALQGDSQLPEEGPALLVANRAGLLPYDAFMVGHAVERACGRDARPRIALGDDWMTLPIAQSRLTRLGAVRACPENVERLLEAGHLVLVFPEGAQGATKEFGDRYRLQRFGRGGVMRVALEQRVPVIPIGVVGSEEAQPLLHKSRTPAQVLGLPFVPLTATFPWLGPLGVLPLPTQWTIRVGAPFALDGLHADAVRDELLLSRLTEELRAAVQALVHDALGERGSVFGFGDES
ncbi:MAG: lysophospholipid acyltransferase family protein [Myxococcota bacterium]